MLIDVFTHFSPRAYVDAVDKVHPYPSRFWLSEAAYDIGARLKSVGRRENYRQILSLAIPPAEDLPTPEFATEVTKLGNDELAKVVRDHSDLFPAFVAAISMTDVDEAMRELARAVEVLGARGVQIYTNVRGRPLDDPTFGPFFDAMAQYDLPIFLHPTRWSAMPDYATETYSKFDAFWCFGWPYETALAMTRLIFSGLFEKHPKIKILTHHLGGMVPYFSERIRYGYRKPLVGSRSTDEDYSDRVNRLTKEPIEYYKLFYGDLALFGAPKSIACGLDFFGQDRVVFASDDPFGSIDETFQALTSLGLGGDAMDKICLHNAETLLNMKLR